MERKPRHLRAGSWAETFACRHLAERGLKLIDRNYRTRSGEIDLIMSDGEAIVFVEVRYRAGTGFGGALATVDARKQARLRRTAEWWLQRHDGRGERPCRMDVVAVSGQPPDVRVEWIRDAF